MDAEVLARPATWDIALATQTLVVFVIRTRRVQFLRSRPSVAMMITPPTAALVGAVLPFTRLADFLGFTTLPLRFFLILVGMIGSYLVLVELVKSRFYAVHPHPRSTPTTHQQRAERAIRRRPAHFVHHHASLPRPRLRPGTRRRRGTPTAAAGRI